MSELTDLIWVEKYRPSSFDNLILENKNTLLSYLKKPESIPSFIFYSSKPGTGKTSTARLIIGLLDCDSLRINSSDERGIDTIREKINLFARSLSSNANSKRCVFMDEADGLTRQAQDSLRNLMEEYSDNCFFIFTANDISKIIEPLRSRCQQINFERPKKDDIFTRLKEIVEQEKLTIEDKQLTTLVDNFYPDIRYMINYLQMWDNTADKSSLAQDNKEFLNMIKAKDIKGIYAVVYSGTFDIMAFNKWYFHYLFANYSSTNDTQICRIAVRLADTEKYWNIGANLEVVFIANILQVMELI